MAKVVMSINIDTVWLFEKTDLSICKACKSQIYSKVVRLWIMSEANGVRLFADKTDVVLCESCFNVFNKSK